MPKTSTKTKYIELANAGKWVALARLWLNDNAPCSREKFFVELGLLMPSTVRGGRNVLLPRQTLVRQAYRMIYKSAKIPHVIEPPPAYKTKGIGISGRIHAALLNGETICKEDFVDTKYFSTLLVRLAKRQGMDVEQVEKGKYRLKEQTK